MKTHIDDDFNAIALISQGHSAFQILWAGVRLGVFEHLHRMPSAPLEALASELKLRRQPTMILMSGLASLGLVQCQGGRYLNTAKTQKYLVSSSVDNIIDVLGWQYHIVYPGVVDFIESLKANTNVGLRHFKGSEPTLYQRLTHQPELEKVFQQAMNSLSAANNRRLANHAELTTVKHLVDAGGGNGTNAIALCSKNPQLKVTVFDSPSVCELAKRNIESTPHRERISLYPGDLFSSPFPPGIDAVLLSHMLTIWSPEKNVVLLRRIYDALPVGGHVMVFNMMSNDSGDGPISCALGSVYFMTIATGEGMLYSWSEQESFLKKAGFQIESRQSLPGDHGLLIGVKQ